MPIIGCGFHWPAPGCWTGAPVLLVAVGPNCPALSKNNKISLSVSKQLIWEQTYFDGCDLLIVKFIARLARLESRSPVKTLLLVPLAGLADAVCGPAATPETPDGCNRSPNASNPGRVNKRINPKWTTTISGRKKKWWRQSLKPLIKRGKQQACLVTLPW